MKGGSFRETVANITNCTDDDISKLRLAGYEESEKVVHPENFEQFQEGLLSLGDCGQSEILFDVFNSFYKQNPVIMICAHGSIDRVDPVQLPDTKYLIQFNRSGNSDTFDKRITKGTLGTLLYSNSFNDVLISALYKSNLSRKLFKEDNSHHVTRNLLYAPYCYKNGKQTAPCQKLTPPSSFYNNVTLFFDDHNGYCSIDELDNRCGIVFIGDNSQVNETILSLFKCTHKEYGRRLYHLYSPRDEKYTTTLSEIIAMFDGIPATVIVQSCKRFKNMDDDTQELSRQISSSKEKEPLKQLLLANKIELLSHAKGLEVLKQLNNDKLRELLESDPTISPKLVDNIMKLKGDGSQIPGYRIVMNFIQSKELPWLTENPEIMLSCLRHTPDSFGVPVGQDIEALFKIIPPSLKNDKEFMKNAIGVFAESFLYADESLKTDIEFIKEVIQINPDVYEHLPTELKTEPSIASEKIKSVKPQMSYYSDTMDRDLLEFLVKHHLTQYVDTLVEKGISTMENLREKSLQDLKDMGFKEFPARRVVRNIKPVWVE